MQGLESTRNASAESITRSSTLTEQTSALLNERTRAGGASAGDKFATSLSFDNDVYGGEKAGNCSRADNACSWKPDANSHSQKAETWRAQRDAQRDKAVERPDGKYEVKPGDSMNDISRRYLKELGVQDPSNKDIAGMSKALADQNKDQYSILKCNPNLIQPGMKFEMPPADKIPGLGKDKSGGTADAVPESGLGNVYGRLNGMGNADRIVGPQTGAGASEHTIEGQGGSSEKIVGGGITIFKDGSGDKGNGSIGECRRDDYSTGIIDTPLPNGFKIPKGITSDFGNGFITDDLVNRDLLSGRSQFMLLPYKLGEDVGKITNIPYKLSDSKGVTLLADDKKDSSSFAKRFLEALALPQMYLI